MPGTSKQRKFVRALLSWYSSSGRTLPWRNITDPYRILLSEVMLQQTQVGRVLEKYPRFLRRFPTLRSLAKAPQRSVVTEWRGMGYNNRAVRVHQLANEVLEKHGGRVPSDYGALRELPGIGKYTANALLSSAFGKRMPVVDVNVRRVFSRVFWKMPGTSAMKDEQAIWFLAGKLVPRRRVYDWNQALMDLGATLCLARRPKCQVCPVARFCCSRGSMTSVPARQLKQEPSLYGVPNRIYRGRIVEQLRGARRVRLDVLARAVLPHNGKTRHRWFLALLLGLKKDGLITISGNGTMKTSHAALV